MCVVDTSMGSSGPHVSCHAKIYIILKQHMSHMFTAEDIEFP